MPHLLISSCSVDKPGVLTLRGAPNERQPWTPTPRIAIDVALNVPQHWIEHAEQVAS
jgi:hypothetical protein